MILAARVHAHQTCGRARGPECCSDSWDGSPGACVGVEVTSAESDRVVRPSMRRNTADPRGRRSAMDRTDLVVRFPQPAHKIGESVHALHWSPS